MGKAGVIIEKVNSFLGFVSGLLFLIIGLLVTWSVVTRNFFANPHTWAMEIARYLLIWAIFTGVSYTMQEKEHISVEILTDMLLRKGRIRERKVLQFIGYILSLVYTATIFATSYKSLTIATKLKKLTTGFIQVKASYLYLAVMIGTTLMGLTILKELFVIGFNSSLSKDN